MGLPKTIDRGLKDVPSLVSDPIYDQLVLRFPLRTLVNEAEHDAAKLMFLSLIRIKKSDDLSSSQVKSVNKYLNALKIFISEFETANYSFDEVSAADILREIMERNNLTQSDFEDEIGKQPVVSKILNGKASLSAEQIRKLCKRFHLSADVFLS